MSRSRMTLSDVVEVLLALAEAQRTENERLARMLAESLAALTERRTASETVSFKRNAKGETQPEVVAVAHNGETLMQVYERGAEVYERGSARFPLPSGAAHAAPLGDGAPPPTPPADDEIPF